MAREKSIRPGARTEAARRFRKQLTKPELWLWLRLKGRNESGLVFRNQHPLGRYVLDFYCPKARLCVEVDGEIHTRDHQRAKDAERDKWLNEQNIHVYRIHAIDLLANPDEAATGVFDLALE